MATRLWVSVERFTCEVYGDGGERGERKYDTEQFLEKSATVYENVEEGGKLNCKVLYVHEFYSRSEGKDRVLYRHNFFGESYDIVEKGEY